MSTLSEALQRHRAKRCYFRLAKQYGRILWNTDMSDWRNRVNALETLADISLDMAANLDFFDDERVDDDGYTPAEWTRAEACLYDLVLYTEPVANVRISAPVRQLLHRPDVRPVLDQLAATDDLPAKGKLLMVLHDVVVPQVGVQAAEALAALAHAYGARERAVIEGGT